MNEKIIKKYCDELYEIAKQKSQKTEPCKWIDLDKCEEILRGCSNCWTQFCNKLREEK